MYEVHLRNRDGLCGKWCHIITDGLLAYEGCIIEQSTHGFYLIDIYSWESSEHLDMRMFHISELIDSRFYTTLEEMVRRRNALIEELKVKGIVNENV